MYKTIYIPVDNSDHSNTAVDMGISIAKIFGSKIVGSHTVKLGWEGRYLQINERNTYAHVVEVAFA